MSGPPTGDARHEDELRAEMLEREAAQAEQEARRETELERALGWLDERTGFSGVARTSLRHVFPDHWSFLLGEVALFCFVILVLTGTFLTFFFQPSQAEVVYEGSFAPLIGEEMSAAYASVLDISFDVQAGLLFRQIHHWTALIFIGVIAAHMIRVFFTGAFRRPRELNWLLGIGLLLLALGEGVTGYSLPDDLLSGTGLRIVYSAVLSIPVIGPDLAFLVFGGEFPSPLMINRLFILHVLLLPGALIAVLTIHVLLVFVQKHTDFAHPGSSETTIVGQRLWPVQTFRSLGLFFLTAALLAGLGGLVQINPVWEYGPYEPWRAIVPAQPDWYVGWLEGILRLGLPIEPTILGVTIPGVFLFGVVLPGILFGIITVWPWIERRLTGDRAAHHVLDLPWQAPLRTSIGMAVLTFFLVTTLAGGNDVIALLLNIDVLAVTNATRLLMVIGPIVAGLVTYRLCRQRQRRAATSPAGGTPIRRKADGGFVEEDH